MRQHARQMGRRFATLALCTAGSLSAIADAQTLAVSGSIGATSDFVFRGLSYTRGDPAAQVALDAELKHGIYFGGFASTSNPNPGPSPPAEVDLWAGFHRSLGTSLSADLRYTHYKYPDDPRVADYDRDEFTATLGVRNTIFLSATYSPNTDAIASTPGISQGDVWALEVSARRQLTQRWSLSAGGGRYVLDEIYGEDYDYWGVTLSAHLAPIELHFALLGADGAAERLFTSRSAGERFAVTVLYRFDLSGR